MPTETHRTVKVPNSD